MLNADTGWTVGAPHWDQSGKTVRGTILKTSDGGDTWTPQDISVAVTLWAVCFFDAQTGWAAGEQGVVLHTTDGGDNWVRQTVNTTAEFRGLIFVDANTGWATGISERGEDLLGDPIWHTTNGGTIWQRQFDTQTAFVFTGIDFIDALHGWCVGFKGNTSVTGGTIYATSDGGATWQNQGPSRLLRDVQFIDTDHGYAAGGSPMLRTSDGGDTWEDVAMKQYDGEGLYALAAGSQYVVAVGDHDFVGRSDHP